jgi:hypothetical protein
VPPTRDEESETQRKAHAKRVRETRRSTQGVTLDEIKSAEKLVQKKNASNADVSMHHNLVRSVHTQAEGRKDSILVLLFFFASKNYHVSNLYSLAFV